MRRMQSSSPYLIEGFGQVDATDTDEDCGQAVLNTYTTALRTSFLSEQDAFDAAVGAYLARKPNVSVKTARHAVAGIICRKL